MTPKEKSNQCAFPADARTMTDGGMTLREYYAGLAMQGLLANANGAMTEGGSRIFSPDAISDLSLKHADALLDKLSIEAQP
jgi:hypothetical protein